MEIAFISANKLRLELDKKQNIVFSSLITLYTQNPGQFIATMLVGNNLALVIYGIAFANLLEPILIIYLHSNSLVLLAQTFISTLIILATAEYLPKMLFRINPNKVLKVFTVPIAFFYFLFYPVTKIAMWISKFVLRIFQPRQLRRLPQAGVRDAGLRRLLLRRHADPRDRRAEHRLAPGLAQGQPRASRTCAPSPGASAGASAAWRCRAGPASARPSRPSWPTPATRKARLELLQRMHKQWPFFRTLLSNLDMVLAKSDLRIAARYVELVEDKTLGKRIFGAIRAEWERANAALSLITGETRAPAVQPDAGALDRAPLPVPGPAEPPAGGADAPLPHARARPGRCHRAAAAPRHPPVDQRHRRRAAQHRLRRLTRPAVSRAGVRACGQRLAHRRQLPARHRQPFAGGRQLHRPVLGGLRRRCRRHRGGAPAHALPSAPPARCGARAGSRRPGAAPARSARRRARSCGAAVRSVTYFSSAFRYSTSASGRRSTRPRS